MLYHYTARNANNDLFQGDVEIPQDGIPDRDAYIARLATFGLKAVQLAPIAAAPPPAATTTPVALPTPDAPTSNVPGTIYLTTAPDVQPPPPGAEIPPPAPVTVLLAGRQRVVATLEDLQQVLDAGGRVVRGDSSLAVTQRLMAPGWTTPGYLVDGNPLNVILGQGWLPGQRELVAQLASEAKTITPTLTDAGDITGAWWENPWVLAAGVGVFLLWRRS